LPSGEILRDDPRNACHVREALLLQSPSRHHDDRRRAAGTANARAGYRDRRVRDALLGCLGTHPHDQRSGLHLDHQVASADGEPYRLLDGEAALHRRRPPAAHVFVREQNLAAALAGQGAQRRGEVLRRQRERNRRLLRAGRQDDHAGGERGGGEQGGAHRLFRDRHSSLPSPVVPAGGD
jgi:hypothetical protein